MDLIVTFVCLTIANVLWFGIVQCQRWYRVFDRVYWQAVALIAVWMCRWIKTYLGA